MAKKTNDEEEFERWFREFIDQEVETDNTPDDDETTEATLPFPRPMDDRVANAMMNMEHHERNFKEDVASVSILIAPDFEKGVLWNGPVEVSFRPKHKVRFRNDRFNCFIYDERFFPICSTSNRCETKRTKGRTITLQMNSNHVWIPGKYILLIHDTYAAAVYQIDFSIDKELNTTLSAPQLCRYGDARDVLVTCIEGKDSEWDYVAKRPGVAQFRRKVMETRRLVLYNEIRKDKRHGVINTCENLLICTRNDDIDTKFLEYFQKLMIIDGQPTCVDCSSLYSPGYNNTLYEPLNEMLSEPLRALCLTNIKELLGPNGKVITRAIIDKIHASKGGIPFWLCGTRQEIDDVLGLYPSLRQFFIAESYVEQEPYTPFELVEAFLNDVVDENMRLNIQIMDHLTRTILQGFKQGTLTSWSLADIHRFVIEEIRPRYLRRAMDNMLDELEVNLQEDDIPFHKLTSGSSAFDESIRELSEMIGLDNVKQAIKTMANQARLFTERRRRGLHTSNKMIFHSIFTGNPGTGKTTVARKLGKIYRSLGLLSKGEVIAVDRTRLVGQYIGETEDNMKSILEEAKGNVLFIDEAYTLATGGKDRKDFGYRVLESLLTVLTQPNPDMLVIFAGYEKEMDAMLNTNPGLLGRFPYRYQFDDYSADQLMEIALHLFERDEYILTDEARDAMQQAIAQALGEKQPNFSNARWIEQFVNNGVIPAMADRIYTTSSNDLQRIEASDITKAYETFKPKSIEPKPTRHRVKGFGA